MDRFSKTKFGKRDLTKENHWSNDVSNFSITKPTFICLGGNGTIDSLSANGQAARNERLMGLKPQENDIFGTYNNFDIISFYYGREYAFDTKGSVTVEESEEIVKNLFLPLCVDLDANKKLPLKEACKNFSNVIFSTFCYGAEVVSDLMYDLKKFLLGYGFRLNEIDEIYSHAFHLSYSPLRVDSFLPFMQINSFKDSFNMTFDKDLWFEKNFGYKLNGVKIDCDKKYCFGFIPDNFITPNQKEISVYSSQLVNYYTQKDALDEHSSSFVDLSDDWSPTSLSKGSKNSECVSKIAGLALAMAGARALQINRKQKTIEPINLQAIYEASESILESFNDEDLKSK